MWWKRKISSSIDLALICISELDATARNDEAPSLASQVRKLPARTSDQQFNTSCKRSLHLQISPICLCVSRGSWLQINAAFPLSKTDPNKTVGHVMESGEGFRSRRHGSCCVDPFGSDDGPEGEMAWAVLPPCAVHAV